jgi:hypothetical protein
MTASHHRHTSRFLASISAVAWLGLPGLCRAVVTGTFQGTPGGIISMNSTSDSVSAGGVDTKASDHYFTANPALPTDSHSASFNTGGSSLSGSASVQYEPGAMDLQGRFTASATAAASPAGNSASTVTFLLGNDFLTLSTATLPAGTPEQYELSARFSDSFSATTNGVPNNLLASTEVLAAVFAQPVADPNAKNTLTGWPLLIPPNATTDGTFSQMLNFQAGQIIEFAGTLNFNVNATSPATSSPNFEMASGQVDITLTPMTPGATFTSAAAPANVPEPGMGAALAIIGMALLARRRRVASQGGVDNT